MNKSQQLFIHFYFLIVCRVSIYLEHHNLHMHNTQQLCIHHYLLIICHVPNIQEYQYYIKLISLQQFYHYLSYIMDHITTHLELQYYVLLIILQLYLLLCYFILDHDSFLYLVFPLSQLITQLENYHLHQMQMDITILQELEYFIHVISFIQYIHYYF